MLTVLTLAFSLLIQLPAHADTAPYPKFSPAEVAAHKTSIDALTTTAAQCLDNYYADHKQFFAAHGFSKYYGNRNPRYNSSSKRRAELRAMGKDPNLESQMEPIACIDLAMLCLKQGFARTGQSVVWDKIYRYLKIDDKVYGTDLQYMLHDLGWKVLYWNPNLTKNDEWDREDRRLTPLAPGKVWMPVWGGHAYRYSEVRNKGTYYKIPVDDYVSLVNFMDQPPRGFDQVPFFVGTAHAGYHVFPGYFGKVIEAHSMRLINSIDNFETSTFNPLGTGGGPRWTATERYRSGIIAIPPEQ